MSISPEMNPPATEGKNLDAIMSKDIITKSQVSETYREAKAKMARETWSAMRPDL
jgi:hypothetical protein